MKKEQHDPEWYLKDPRTRKWMVQCSGCLRWGYRADAPVEFFGRSQLEKYLELLKLDTRGLCDSCQAVPSPEKVSP